MELFEHYIKTDTIIFKYAKGKSAMPGKEFHVFNEIIYFINGDAELITEHSHAKIKPQSLIVIPKETYHQLKVLGNAENYHRCIINFSYPSLKDYATFEADSEIKYLFSKLISNITSQDNKEVLSAVLTLLINKISNNFNNAPVHVSQNEMVLSCINYINNNLNKELSVLTLAKTINTSESTLAHVFKKEMGISLHRYITEKRLITAYKRISSGEAITSAYLECGFKDYSNFYRQYKKFFGFAPSQQ